jgi:primosomal replication protein N''
VNTASKDMFDKVADPGTAPARLAALARNLELILSRVRALVAAIDQCPHASELERAALAGTPEAIACFLDRAQRSLRRFDARNASLGALGVVAPYFDEAWVAARRSAIEAGSSNAAALAEIVRALPTLGPYLEFRIRSSRLGEIELALFRIFRTKEKRLAALDPDDLDPCVRHTIGCEARLSW